MNYLTKALYTLGIFVISLSVAKSDVMGEKKNLAIQPQRVELLSPHIIDLGADFYTTRLTFSPDGKFLAVGDKASANIVIWDIKNNSRQSTIYARSFAGFGRRFAHWDDRQSISWSPDGSFLTNGIGIAHANGNRTRQEVENRIEIWDPMTGQVLNLIDGSAPYSRLNKDGTKLLSVSKKSNEFYVFDIATSTKQEYKTQGVVVVELGWTANDDVIVVGATATMPNWGSAVLSNGEKPVPRTLVAQIFPHNKNLDVKTLQLAAPISDSTSKTDSFPAFSIHSVVTNSATNRVAVQFSGFINEDGEFAMGGNGDGARRATGIAMIDVSQLRVDFWKANEELSDLRSDIGSITFSPNGQYLFALSQNKNIGGVILDSKTGVAIGTLPYSEFSGIAVSPDSTLVAIGRGRKVAIYKFNGKLK